VHRWLKSKGALLVSYTQPNAALYEDAVLFEALVARYDMRLVILAVVMDKLREQGIREGVAAFVNDPDSAERVVVKQNLTDRNPEGCTHDFAGPHTLSKRL
jgi:hypothetical protein